MYLRPATLEDVPALVALGRESFIHAFGHLYRPEDLAAFLDEVHAESAVAEEIAGDQCRHQLAIGDDGALIGYCKLRYPSKMADIARADDPLELGQLYCAGSATGQGVGGALMRWALSEGDAGGHDAMVLSVYSENYGAQRFYERHGFAKTADTIFRVGEHIDAEFLYEKPLRRQQTGKQA